jgi:nitroreductase/NAD-dependent dihydropyrimidine dehydrogenase PreA subunit
MLKSRKGIMGLLIVDESKCKKDGICARECPMAIIKLKDKESHPELAPGDERFCLICGHCIAVCPHGALNHALIPIEDCPPIIKELVITEEQAVQFLRSRRSIRFFNDKPVEKDKIQRLIEIGRYAPTSSNSQMVEWLVFTDQAKIKEIAGLTVDWVRSEIQQNPQFPRAPYMPLIVAAWDAGYDAVLRGAAAMVVASAPKEAGNGMVDLTLALSYLELVAPTMDLGTCWAGLLQGALLAHPPLKKALGIPEGHSHHYPMMLGYPKAKYFRLPERKPPKITWK